MYISEDVANFPSIIKALVDKGYSKKDIDNV